MSTLKLKKGVINSIHSNMKMVLGVLILALFSTLTATAQTVVKDKDSGMPVGFATVVDEQGLFLGQTDANGLMPNLKDSKMFRITHVAYESIRDSVSHLGTELLLTPADLNLGEVVKVKGKPYCLRLTGYLRDYSILGHEVTIMKQKVEPVWKYYDHVGELYMFYDGKDSKWIDIAVRDAVTGEAPKRKPYVSIRLKTRSIVEELKKSANNPKLVGKGDVQQIVNCDSVVGSIVRDKDNKMIRVDYDAMAPDTIQVINAIIAKLRIYSDQRNYIYRMGDTDHVSQADLAIYKCNRHNRMKLFGWDIDLYDFDEFYVDRVDCLSKDEYKAAVKEVKARRKSKKPQMTMEEIDQYMAKLHVEPISDELKQLLKISAQMKAEREKTRSDE